MKTSVELAVSGIQALQLHHRGRKGYRAKASYVDETLFGSHTGHQAVVVDFDPPWVDKQPVPQRPLLWSPEATRWEADAGPSQAPVPPRTPRKKSKYRLKSCTPSYCDETLFGRKSGGQDGGVFCMKAVDTAMLHPLLWTPPSSSRNQRSLTSSHQRQKPLRAFHQEVPRFQETAGFEAQHKEHFFWKHPENDSEEDNPDDLGWAGHQPVSQVDGASSTFQPPVTGSRTKKQQNHHLPDGSVTSSASRPHSKGILGTPSGRLSRNIGSCKSRPPWK